jgi:hypothetical protein
MVILWHLCRRPGYTTGTIELPVYSFPQKLEPQSKRSGGLGVAADKQSAYLGYGKTRGCSVSLTRRGRRTLCGITHSTHESGGSHLPV